MKPLLVAGPSEATDAELVDAARDGSDVAFEALFRRYRDRITAYVRSIVSDHARAEDIVQEAFMSALRSLRSSDREVAFKPWVYEIAKNACIDHLRKAGRAAEVSIDADDFSPVDEGRMSIGVASTDAAYSTREDLDTLRMAFNDLPEAQREVLISRELEGLSYEGIASRTGLSRSAVESMLFRARRTLKDGFDDIATGERCQRMQTVMVHMTDGPIGLRQERRLVRHLDDCAACRREAIALGLDDLVLRAPSRTKSVLTRVAGILPFPAFMRRRWLEPLLGPAGQSGAADGMSLAAKAAAVLAAAAIAGGGAGVAQKTGVIGKGDAGAQAGAPAGQDVSPGAGGTSSGGAGAARGGGDQGGGSGAKGGGSGAGAPGAGGRGSGDGPGAGGNGPLGDAGAALAGVGAKSGANGAGGVVNGAQGTVGGTVNGVGGNLNDTVTGVGGTVTEGAGGAVDKVAPGAGGAITQPVQGVTDTAGNTTKGVTDTVTGVTNKLLPPSQPTDPTKSLLP